MEVHSPVSCIFPAVHDYYWHLCKCKTCDVTMRILTCHSAGGALHQQSAFSRLNALFSSGVVMPSRFDAPCFISAAESQSSRAGLFHLALACAVALWAQLFPCRVPAQHQKHERAGATQTAPRKTRSVVVAVIFFYPL